ncbi:MAG: hypothetical protein ACE5IH_10595, partial [Thermodesulfobacteriota bacterium]
RLMPFLSGRLIGRLWSRNLMFVLNISSHPFSLNLVSLLKFDSILEWGVDVTSSGFSIISS